MNTNCPVRPRKRSMSRAMCSGVKAMKSTTTSNFRLPIAARAEAGLRMSPVSILMPSGTCRPVLPRRRCKSWMPASTATREQAELIMPVPPMKRTFMIRFDYHREQKDTAKGSPLRSPSSLRSLLFVLFRRHLRIGDDFVHELSGQLVVVRELDRERSAAAGDRAQIRGVFQRFRHGDVGTDDFFALGGRVHAFDAASTVVEVADDVAHGIARAGDLQ